MSHLSEILETTRQMMTVLPMLNRMMAVELRQEIDETATMPQFRVLAYLSEQPITLTALAKIRRVSLQSAGELVQSLVERQWVERMPNPADRRQSFLQLTEEGQNAYLRIQQRMTHHLSEYLEMLSLEELRTVQGAFTALQRVIHVEEPGETSDDSQ